MKRSRVYWLICLCVAVTLLSVWLSRFGLNERQVAKVTTPAGDRSATRAAPTKPDVPVMHNHPLADIENIARPFREALSESREVQLSIFESELRENLKNGWRPPWSELEIKFTDQEISAMSTEELGTACFASGLPARTILLYDRPDFGIRRLEVLHKGYAELFRRPDSWKALVAMVDFYVAELDPHGEESRNVNAIMGLTTLPEFYSYPPLRKALVGHERELISAHIRGIEKLSAYLGVVLELERKGNAKPFFSDTSLAALIQSGLLLGETISSERYDVARSEISRQEWPKERATRHAKELADRAAYELKKFVE